MAQSKSSKKSQNGKPKAPSASSSSTILGKKTGQGAKEKQTKQRATATSLEAQLKKLQAENDALRKNIAANESINTADLICRPPRGVAGNGFNLQSAMRLEDNNQLYTAIRRSVRNLVNRSPIDCSVRWRRQPTEVIAKIISIAREQHNYLKQFPGGWPVEEMIRSSLKNKRAYKYRMKELTYNPGRGKDKDDVMEDESEGEDESARSGYQGKGKGRATQEDYEDEDRDGNDSLVGSNFEDGNFEEGREDEEENDDIY